MTFSRPLTRAQQSSALSEVSNNFMSNPVQLMGQNVTVMENPVLEVENGVKRQSKIPIIMQSSFPVIHKVDNVGIFVQLLM